MGTPVAAAYDAVFKALPTLQNAGATALFRSLAAHGDFDDPSAEKAQLQCFNVLMLDRANAAHGKSPILEILQKCDAGGGREEVSIPDFKNALKDSGLLGIEDNVWRQAYSDASRSGYMNCEALGDLFKQATQGLPKGVVSEATLMVGCAEAYMAEFDESSIPFKQAINEARGESGGEWKYHTLQLTLKSVNPSVTDLDTRKFFKTCADLSQSCTQAALPPIIGGQTEAVQIDGGQGYGGDVLPDEVIWMAACQTQILVAKGSGEATPRAQTASDEGGGKKGGKKAKK